MGEGPYGCFRRHFRITFNVDKVAEHENHRVKADHLQTPVDWQIATALHRFASGESLRSIAMKFGWSEASVSVFTDRLLKAFIDIFQTRADIPIIRWPKGEEVRRGFIL